MKLTEKQKRHIEELNKLPQTIAARFKKGQRPWNYGLRKFVKRICQFCGKEFEIDATQIKRGRGKYCSQECMYNARRKSELVEKIRKLYDQGFTYKQIANKLNITISCVSHHIYKYNLCNRFGDGIIREVTNGRIRNLLRKYGITKCELCEFDRVLDVAHIIPRSKGGRSVLSNVLLLCPNCHRLFDYDLLTEDEKQKLLSIERVKETLKKRWK